MPGGFEERDGGGWLELAAYVEGEPAEALRAVFPGVVATTVEPGWEARWREFHRPVHAGGLWIGPPWEVAPADEPCVVVDPGRAFGTGAHATTRLCVELLARAVRGSVLDAGCGSGVIAVAASRLGFAPVLAVDVDPVAVDAARETALRNGVDVEVVVADVLCDRLPRVDLVVANIELRAVEALLGRRPAERAITSGYLARDRPTTRGWIHADRLELDGWAADVLRSA